MVERLDSRLTVRSYARLCAVLAAHVGLLLGFLFASTNSGRRVNFGTYYFDGWPADMVVFFFWLLTSACVITTVGMACYSSVSLLVRLAGGLQFRSR
jgi:hypothetical protein